MIAVLYVQMVVYPRKGIFCLPVAAIHGGDGGADGPTRQRKVPTYKFPIRKLRWSTSSLPSVFLTHTHQDDTFYVWDQEGGKKLASLH